MSSHMFISCNLCPGSPKDLGQRRRCSFSNDSVSGFGLLPLQDAGLRGMLASPAGRVRAVEEPNLPDPNFELVAA